MLPDPMWLAAGVMFAYGMYKALSSGGGMPLYWTNRRLRALWAKDLENGPMHLPCNIPSPDGVLFCRLEVGHTGWHCHHGPVSWHSGQWAEDDFDSRFGNIRW